MSHGLTIPEGNKSPYPLQEPPHAPRAPVATVKQQRDRPASQHDRGMRDRGVFVGAAIGLGAVAALAAAVFGFRARRG